MDNNRKAAKKHKMSQFKVSFKDDPVGWWK